MLLPPAVYGSQGSGAWLAVVWASRKWENNAGVSFVNPGFTELRFKVFEKGKQPTTLSQSR